MMQNFKLKKRSSNATKKEPHNGQLKRNWFNQAFQHASATEEFNESHARLSDQHLATTSDRQRESRVFHTSQGLGAGLSGGGEPSQIELQTTQSTSFFPSSSNFKVVDSQFNSFRDNISTGNVIINVNHPENNETVIVRVPSELASYTGQEAQAEVEVKSLKQPMKMRKCSEIYYRHLLLLGHGSPLWIPEPSNSLPIEYQKGGIGIGDVGILKDSGGFDFLFNIYQPLNDPQHPINPRTMPDGFRPLDLPDERDMDSHVQFKNHSFLSSSHVDSHRDNFSGLIFESSAQDGAILTMPNGASSVDLDSMAAVRKYVRMNVEQWYKYANDVRGRDARNGDLRLVIGKTSATTWGMATFSKESEEQARKSLLRFRPLQPWNPSNPDYQWEYSGKAEVKAGPDEYEIEKLRKFDRLKGEEVQAAYENQSLFVRTINVTLQDEHRSNDTGNPSKHFQEFDRDPSHKERVYDSEMGFGLFDGSDDDLARLRDIVPNIDDLFGRLEKFGDNENDKQTPTAVYNYTFSHIRRSSSNPKRDSLSRPAGSGLGDNGSPSGTSSPLAIPPDDTSDPEEQVEGLQNGPSPIDLSRSYSLLSFNHPGSSSQPTDPTRDPDFYFGNYAGSSGASPPAMEYQDNQTVESHPSPSPNPADSGTPLPSELHPSKIINEYLLNRAPEATMAITEDGDWISVLQASDIIFPEDDVLLSRIKDTYDVCVEEGVVFLNFKA